jgi:hypothetical protein
MYTKNGNHSVTVDCEVGKGYELGVGMSVWVLRRGN